jgi:hypothetical protein
VKVAKLAGLFIVLNTRTQRDHPLQHAGCRVRPVALEQRDRGCIDDASRNDQHGHGLAAERAIPLEEMPQLRHRSEQGEQRPDQHEAGQVESGRHVDHAAHQRREGKQEKRRLEVRARADPPSVPADHSAGHDEQGARRRAQVRSERGRGNKHGDRRHPARHGPVPLADGQGDGHAHAPSLLATRRIRSETESSIRLTP